MLPETVKKMPWTSQFSVDHSSVPRKVTVLDSSRGEDTANAINAAFFEVVSICIDRDLFHLLAKKHSEPFLIVGARYDKPVYVERFSSALFGVTQRGAHMFAYTYTPEGEMKVWIQRRAKHLYTYPGMLDATVAGGVKSGVSPFETMLAEAEEEASLPADLIRQHCRSRGILSHMGLTGKGFPGEQGLVVPNIVYTYDIELPEDVVPTPRDDEVECFYAMTVQEVKAALLNEEFNPGPGAVLIDFLIRHSYLTPENEPDLVEISMRLHRMLPFRTGPP